MYTISRVKEIAYILTVGLLMSSCFNVKKITYFQKGPGQSDTIKVAETYIPKIQVGDILSIYVNSLSPEASAFFNPYTAGGSSSSSGAAAPGLSQASAPGFLVDADGNISLPLVGVVSVKNLTIVEAQDVIRKKLSIYLKDPTVSMLFLNYKVSILGEVNKPGAYVVPNESITIPELITLAGDLSSFANRSEIEIIRDNNGKKEFGIVDLTSRNVFTSPYYYLHANDIVYVRPGKIKVAQNDLTLRILPLVLTALSVIIILIK